MKRRFTQFIKTVQYVQNSLGDNDKIAELVDLNRCLASKSDDNYFLILKNMIYITDFILINLQELEKIFLKKGHIAVHISTAESKSLFPFQIIKNSTGEYQLVISFKTKVGDWMGRGLDKKVKEALILKVNGDQSRWIPGVDAVVGGKEKIKTLMREIKLTSSVDSKNIHKITEGALYIGKNNEQKKSLISEFAVGGSLDNLENGHKLSFVNIFIICYGSLIGLQELHLQKITHNDLHEGNIYLMLEGKNNSITRPIIADLGAATQHENTLSESFTSQVKTDTRKFSSIMMKIIKSDYGITNKFQKQYIQKLFTMMENNKWGGTQYNPQEFLKKLDLLIDEIIQKEVKDGLTLKKLISTYYPSAGSLKFVESKPLSADSKTDKISINMTKSYRLLKKPAKDEQNLTSAHSSTP